MWKPIKTALHDGTTIWIAVKRFMINGISVSDKSYQRILIVRYDSWNHQFRTLEKGEVIDFPEYQLLAWREFEYAPSLSSEELNKFLELAPL